MRKFNTTDNINKILKSTLYNLNWLVFSTEVWITNTRYSITKIPLYVLRSIVTLAFVGTIHMVSSYTYIWNVRKSSSICNTQWSHRIRRGTGCDYNVNIFCTSIHTYMFLWDTWTLRHDESLCKIGSVCVSTMKLTTTDVVRF